MQRASIETDVTVIGGGLSGVCAAIAAARLGSSVALVQNRPVLGGNSSSEIRVWVCSATAHGTQRYARETGIMGELFLENQFVNQEGNPYLWDLVVLEAVRREPNIDLYLNTDVHHLAMTDDGTIASVTGWQMGSEREMVFTSPVFLDCTGDGLIGYLAGAEYRVGREARAEHDESLAPEVADTHVLGSTILFYTKDEGRPVPFVATSFAIDVTATSIPERRIIRSGDNGCAYWWIEWGGELDTIHDNETIRNELWSVIYGIWDYIKNSGRFPDSDTMTLEWVGSIPGKRESRRLMGDHILTQHDVLGQVHFDDTVALGAGRSTSTQRAASTRTRPARRILSPTASTRSRSARSTRATSATCCSPGATSPPPTSPSPRPASWQRAPRSARRPARPQRCAPRSG